MTLNKLRALASRLDEGFTPSQYSRDEIEPIIDSLPALLDIAEAAQRFAHPFDCEPTHWGQPDTPIDCCVNITYQDILDLRDALNQLQP